MKLIILRLLFNEKSTRGIMTIDGDYFGYTLEDKVRSSGVKVPGQTAIPEGEYKVILSMSNRFKKIMPEVLNVPNFAGVRIHGGNTAEDTEGCPLVCKSAQGPDYIFGSLSDVLIARIKLASDKGENIVLKVINGI